MPKVVQNSQSKQKNGFSYTQRIPRRVGYGSCLKALQISDSCYRVFYSPNDLGLARLGIVVAKKFLPRAVDRNLSKREVRQLFRMHKIKYLGVDLVVMVRNSDHLKNSSRIDGLGKLFNRVLTKCAGS